MALIEEQIVITRKDADGNLRMQFPVTHKDYVEGLAEIEEAASKGGVPVGHIYFSLEKTVPTGSLPLNGGTYAHLAYIDLWNYILEQGNYLTFDEWQAMYDANDGNVPFYAITRSGSQSQWRFRVPSINGWVKGASSLEEVGSYLKAGLPNITGSWIPVGVSNHSESSDPVTGAFTNKAGNNVASWSKTGSLQTYGFDFDASRSNPIYGNSDTVQPPSIVGMWLVKAFGTVSNVGNQDIADVSAGLTRVENKMDEYTDNVTYIDSFIVESWRSGTEWYRKYSDGTIEQGGYVSTTTATYPLPFANTDYTLLTGSNRGGSNNSGNFNYVTTWTTTGFTHALDSNQKVWWYAVGQGAT